jgi:hypothetical protein
MPYDFYREIRETNTIKYGTDISEYGPTLLANLYSERTHFIFELLQNAEDACTRAIKNGERRKFSIKFKLYPNRLEVSNNGINFTKDDVTSICRIAASNKDGTVAQIGKFGIGFKSVYAYTNSPTVISGIHSFTIKDYIHPFPYQKQETDHNNETTFIIPFDNPEIKPVAYEEIKKRMSNLDIRSMLFLESVEEISFRIGTYEINYTRSSQKEDGHSFITLRQIDNGMQRIREEWLVFEKPLGNFKQAIKTAYQMSPDQKTGKSKIVPTEGALLFVYFPTAVETHLKFIVHGPFNTTPARDNIKQNDVFNNWLIDQIADFISKNMLTVKELNLFDVDFLTTLPIDTEHFVSRESIFRPIYQEVKNTLCSDIPLLPTYNKSHTTQKQAFLSRSEDMRKLVSSSQIDTLFTSSDGQWLDSAITENRPLGLWKYLSDELQIRVVDSETFAKSLNEVFFEKQTDAWIIRFYDFLGDQKALWREGRESIYGDRPGTLRTKPIIRLENNSHMAPFDSSGKPLVYLPSKDPETNKLFKNLVKYTIGSDKEAKAFLKALGIEEPDLIATVLDIILVMYNGPNTITDKLNLEQVKTIIQCIESCPENKKEKSIERLQGTAFLKAVNAGTNIVEYKQPSMIHLGEKFTKRKDCETYFAGNNQVWFLHEDYLNIAESTKLTKTLTELGCKNSISITYREPNYVNNVIVTDFHGWHVRGLNGFDPECELESLDYVLSTITVEKAAIIWEIAKNWNSNICGEVEKSSKHDFHGAKKTFQYSKLGQSLMDAEWLPDTNSNFHKPSEVKLSDLHSKIEKTSEQARILSQKLGFIMEPNEQLQKLCENAPEHLKELINTASPLLKIFETASPEVIKRIIDSAHEIMATQGNKKEDDQENNMVTIQPNRSELFQSFTQAMQSNQPSEEPEKDKHWRGPTPEQEEEIKKQKIKALEQMIDDSQILTKEEKRVTQTKSKNNTEQILREFLLELYDGHCQICNQRLDLGSNKAPYFEIYRLDEHRNLHGDWSNQEHNAICLCPNCHALLKYGVRDLSNIMNKARIISAGDEAPEEISERYGDFYVVRVSVAGADRDLMYSPVHMASVIAFIKFGEGEQTNNR